jgi:predicted RND superfamily exporter protein
MTGPMSQEQPCHAGGPNPRSLARLAAWLIRTQTTRPYLVLLAALISVALAGLGASQLTLKTSFGELLPQNKESVLVANAASERLLAASTLTIVAQGESPEGLKRFIDALAPKIRELGPSVVGNVDDGVRASRAFFEKNKLLYASLADIEKVHEQIIERYDYAIAKQLGTALDDEPEPITADSLRKRMEGGNAKIASAGPKNPDGYYMEADQRMIALLVRTPVSSGDLERSTAFLSTIQRIIDEVEPRRFDPTMTIGFTGDFITSAEEYSRIKGDLSHVGIVGVSMILGVVFLFYLRLRPMLAMILTIAIGAVWTFGFAYLAIGHLNSSTGFLVTIVVGNGINFGIIYMSRYLEARRTHALVESIRIAQLETWLPTLAAAGAAMVAYGSLIITDFRGFKHFGLIGGIGMLLCWASTYLFMPAILVVFERIKAIDPEQTRSEWLRGLYGRPFAFLVVRWPRAIALLGIVTGLIGTGLTYRYFVNDPMEYDMANTRNESSPDDESSARQLGRRVDKIVGRQGQDGLAILTDRLDQVLPLKAVLDARRDAAPKNARPFDRVVTIYDLLPTDQAKKIPLIREALDRLSRAHRRGFIKPADWSEIEKLLPTDAVAPIGIEDLPEQVARTFIEKDGTRGKLVYIVPTSGRSVWDAHYLIQWADSFRRTKLPDGSVVKGSGRSVIFADMILSVVKDAPKAIIVSVSGTLLIILIAFRAQRSALAVIGTLALGLVWMIALLALHDIKIVQQPGLFPHVELVGMKLNFLNFVVLPISVGVGADYAVNIMQRYRVSGRGQIHKVVRETGGAVILCSLTTVLGYLALGLSVNRAIASFGYAAAAGEVSCLLAGVLVLPAFLAWREGGSISRQPEPELQLERGAAGAP